MQKLATIILIVVVLVRSPIVNLERLEQNTDHGNEYQSNLDEETNMPQKQTQNQQVDYNEEENDTQQELPQSPDEDQQQQGPQNTQEELGPEQLRQKFNGYLQKYSKKYSQQQKALRLRNFQNNQKLIQQTNSKGKRYKLKQNQFLDLSQQEFKQSTLMTLPDQKPRAFGMPMTLPENFQFEAVDWRDQSTNPKYQGKCGSCWAFSVVAVLQTYVNINYGQLNQFSQQQLLDCCTTGCMGCRGGWPSAAIKYISEQGIAQAQDYPYQSQRQQCQDVQKTKYLNEDIPYSYVNDVESLLFTLQQGPVSVIVDASQWSAYYSNGIYDQCDEDKINHNHAVVCTGVDEDGVWIVRNSWGISWGDQGYIYLPAGNSCGIADLGVIPQLSFD